ncbi:MAG: long-chain fatty acid--CoA ligase [Solirubrobacteraceae bacterium]|nr:long-chain fatty acid--CoA ligase [Solirubrobacteraceae bacterium]
MALEAAARRSGAALTVAGGERTLSYDELGRELRKIAGGLIALGVAAGDRVSILAETRLEWALADLGSLCAGAVVVPIYHTNSPDECAYVLAHAGSRVVFCEDAAQVAKIAQVRSQCPDLEHVVVIEGEAPGALTLGELRSRAGAPDLVDERVAAIRPDDLATLVYTSGTTGPPKGCMLTHSNVLETMRLYTRRLGLDREPPSIFMFLPLAHVLARVTQLVTIDVGGTLIFWRGDPKRLADDLKEAQPTHVPAVPRIYEKVQRAILDRVEAGERLKRELFGWALREGHAMRVAERGGGSPGPLRRVRHALADRLVLRQVRSVFGGRLQQALVGAAPIGAEVLEFFDACGVEILEGYGMTESCAAATLNLPGSPRFGTVGPPLDETQVAIDDDGEVLLRGPNVFPGYYRDEAATRETLRDGWLLTGDLGELDAEGCLRLTGRKKDIIITSSGKNVTPVNIENALRESRWVSEAVVYGDRRQYLVALLTLDPDQLGHLAELVGAPPATDAATLSADPRARAALQAEVDAANARFARIEQVKRFAILDHDLTQAAGELTPTLKIKRAFIYDRYKDLFASLYDD